MTEGKDRDCKSCGAPLKFARYLKKDGELGRRIPVSLDSVERRLVFLKDENGQPRVTEALTFVSHFADCPDAEDHRTEREDGG